MYKQLNQLLSTTQARWNLFYACTGLFAAMSFVVTMPPLFGWPPFFGSSLWARAWLLTGALPPLYFLLIFLVDTRWFKDMVERDSARTYD